MSRRIFLGWQINKWMWNWNTIVVTHRKRILSRKNSLKLCFCGFPFSAQRVSFKPTRTEPKEKKEPIKVIKKCRVKIRFVGWIWRRPGRRKSKRERTENPKTNGFISYACQSTAKRVRRLNNCFHDSTNVGQIRVIHTEQWVRLVPCIKSSRTGMLLHCVTVENWWLGAVPEKDYFVIS